MRAALALSAHRKKSSISRSHFSYSFSTNFPAILSLLAPRDTP